MRAKQFNVNLLSITNCSLSNSISLCQQSNAYPSDDNCDQADLYIDQLVDIIQIGCNVKRRLRAGLIRQCQCLNEAIFGKADDMIKIDSDPIKIDGVIGRNTEMDGLDYQLATLERLLRFPFFSLSHKYIRLRLVSLFIYLPAISIGKIVLCICISSLSPCGFLPMPVQPSATLRVSSLLPGD